MWIYLFLIIRDGCCGVCFPSTAKLCLHQRCLCFEGLAGTYAALVEHIGGEELPGEVRLMDLARSWWFTLSACS